MHFETNRDVPGGVLCRCSCRAHKVLAQIDPDKLIYISRASLAAEFRGNFLVRCDACGAGWEVDVETLSAKNIHLRHSARAICRQ